MFELRAIEKRFDAVVALNGAHLQVAPGEIRALLGSNGSGKSTMIKVLAGLVNPNGGQVLVDGNPVEIHNGQDSRKLGIATAFQDLSLIPTMSVRDNILLGNEPCNKFGVVDKKACDALIDSLLKRFHIDCDPNAYVQTLMPSVQTMLEVAKAVSLKPRLLLLDEVTASLHYDEIEVLFSVMRELKEEGVAMLYVTHRMNEVFQVCDTTTIMRSGETVTEGKMSDFTLDDIVYYMTGQRPDKASKAAEHVADENGEVLLNVKDLAVYPKVRDLNLRACKGEIVGIGGLQGQGQSEFIRALLGAEPIQDGVIEYDGKQVHFKSPTQAVNAGMGFISGERNREAMFPVRTVEENILAGKVAKGKLFAYMTPKSNHAFANSAVEKYNIKIGALDHPANSLSGGNQQKLVVARWIAMQPKLLLLDDPTKGVDIHSRQEIHRILRQCADEGMTIIISSSESEELLDVSDRIYVFYEGCVSAVLEGANKTPELLVAAMMGMTGSEVTAEGGKAE
ncbi:MAG: sugar ABC transporter ATP-binding protein [Oscillospiraceae bacterium]|nr:sugar ABC transporter ATP-binding protein [Oscillospiraceae bacterium]